MRTSKWWYGLHICPACQQRICKILYCCTGGGGEVGGGVGRREMVEGNGGNGTEPQIDAIFLENKMLPKGVGSVSPVLSHAVLPLFICLHGGVALACLFFFFSVFLVVHAPLTGIVTERSFFLHMYSMCLCSWGDLYPCVRKRLTLLLIPSSRNEANYVGFLKWFFYMLDWC